MTGAGGGRAGAGAAGPTPKNPDYEAAVREGFAGQGAMAHLGAELVRVEPGYVEIGLPYRDEVTQQHGYFHGGLIATIGDSAGGFAAFSLMPACATVLTVEYKINLVAPADGERLVARGQVEKAGRTLTVCRLSVEVLKDGVPRTCALGQQTVITLHDTPDA